MEMVRWNRSKIMLVGQGRAGKTALARSMMGEPFRETPSTIGGELFEREIREGNLKERKLAECKRPEKELESLIVKNGMEFEKERQHVSHGLASLEENINNRKSVGLSVVQISSSNGQLHNRKEKDLIVDSPVLIPERGKERKIDLRDVNRDVLYRSIAENMHATHNLSKLTISLCDFGGQDVFNALHAFFMTRYGVYMLVFDMELFQSKVEKDRESCHQNIKVWLNSIAVHTYDRELEKTAPVVLVGTRRDRISDMDLHDAISNELEEKYSSHMTWPSLIPFQRKGKSSIFRSREEKMLYYFPINNTKRLLESTTLTQILQKLETTMMESEEVKREIPVIWMKALDEIRDKGKRENKNFLLLEEVTEIGGNLGVSLCGVSELLRYLYEMGILIWIDEPSLREIVILDPIEYFVKPVTRIICKHLASKNDPYAIKHELPIHKECRRLLSEDWKLMLEFGLVSERLAIKLLKSESHDEILPKESLEKIMLLMKRFGLMIPLHFEEENNLPGKAENESQHFGMDVMFFVPTLVPEEPDSIILTENNKEDKKIVSRLRQRFTSLSQFLSSSTVFLTFSLPSNCWKEYKLFSYDEVQKNGFLPNGLFDRFIARILSNLPDLVVKCTDTRFIAFKDMIRIDCNGKLIRFTNQFHQNMIKIDIEEGDTDLRELVEEWLEVAKKLIRECYKCLVVTVLLPVDCEEGNNGLISLEGLLLNRQQNVMTPEYISEDGLCRLISAKFIDLQSKWLSLPPPPFPRLPLSQQSRSTPRHVMLSYCWGYKKDHVIALEGKLKQLGYDIWRDENGSSIVPPLAGDTDESMARAVEKSSLIIIFVCKAYYHSANCKKEAQYCSQKRKPLLFVMLDENYHTSSSPEAVEGWLGLLVGTQLWYALWTLDHQQLESASSAIANRIGNVSLLSQSQQLLEVTRSTLP
jgi:GTPase SAR1 family protein